ncbi:MAG: Ni/Fe-hydrogenase, b-type cytochrome subunit [Polyangiales bacterium]
MLKKPAIHVPESTSRAPQSVAAADGGESVQLLSVLVYELPVRLWHWVSAAAIVVLSVTGYWIGDPLPTQPGEASASYLMGYIRFAHFAAGYLLAVAFVGRFYWAFVGNKQSHEMFTLPVFSAKYWRGLVAMFKWYGFMSAEPQHFAGHNPLARTSMVLGYSLLTVVMCCTGFALYGEGTQAGSWASRAFGWVFDLCGSSQNVHTLHHLGMWAMVIFVIAHIYAVIRDDVVGPHSTVSSMISGRRAFKE